MDLLIIDELGYLTMDKQRANLFFNRPNNYKGIFGSAIEHTPVSIMPAQAYGKKFGWSFGFSSERWE